MKRFPYDKLEYALDLYIASVKQTLALTPPAPSSESNQGGYDEDELMTIKEAMAYIPVSRSKLYEMRKEGMLDTIERSSRQKRLLRAQVEAARLWSRNKGKW